MPQLPTITYPDGTRLYRWRIPDDVARSEARAAEREAEKSLIHKVFGSTAILEHTSDGAPYVTNQSGMILRPAGLISISHTRGIVCMAVSDGFTIGIDVERVTERTVRVRHKFLSDLEISQIPETDPVTNTIAWTAKEAAYKAALTPGLSMKDDIQMDVNRWLDDRIQDIYPNFCYPGFCYNGFIKRGAEVSFNTLITDNLVTTLATIIIPPENS